MKKALIITYYWPPAGGSGVQRWLKFSKYLPSYGWNPVIFTPEQPESPVIDTSLEKDVPQEAKVIRYPIFEPYNIYKKLSGQKKGDRIQAQFVRNKKESRFIWNLAVWIRGNLLIPDPRKFWIKPSVRFLKKYLQENKIDVIITTGPPHSMHLIGAGIKEETGTPWIADFRDPWSGMDYLDDMHLTRPAWRKHQRMEKRVLKNADRVVTVSPTLKSDLERLSGRQVDVIYNGYDPDDFNFPVNVGKLHKTDFFRIVYSGVLSKYRSPGQLITVLEEFCKEDAEFYRRLSLDFYGMVDPEVEELIMDQPHLRAKYQNHGYIPHDEIIAKYREASLLLLLLNDTKMAKLTLTGKFYEYMASGRPILTLGPEDSDIGEILKRTGTGYLVDFNNTERIRSVISSVYRADQELLNGYDENEVKFFSRERQAQLLVSILKEMQ